jgi:methylmalonyl-CoA mutase C-terminal domain/subunit
MTLFPKTVQLIRQKGGKDILVIGGGIIPKSDLTELKEVGIAQIFGPGTPIDEISNFIKANLPEGYDDK